MNDNYVKLIDFILGKYKYTVMRNNDKVLYFEVVDNRYVKPILSFNLYDNEGKSLTSVNQHFFMNQLVNRINVAFKKGIFVSEQEIFEYLTKVKNSIECDDNVKKLFKGSYMSEINESNFENNKRGIVNYLDNIKYDTFVNYNNVSIFDGSLEKNNADDSITYSNFKTEEVSEDVLDDIDIQDESVDNSQNIDSSIDVVDSENDAVDNINFDNIPVDNSLGDYLSSSDYFSNLSSNDQNVDTSMNNGQSVDQFVDVNQNIVEPVNDVQNVDVSMNSQSFDQFVDINQNVVEPVNDVQNDTGSLNNEIYNGNINTSNDLNTENYFDYSVESGMSSSLVDEGNVVQNDVIQENINSSDQIIDNGQLSDNMSVDSNNNVSNNSSFGVDYIDQVKSRIENSNNVELGTLDSDVSDIEKTMISDKLGLPELDDVNNDLPGSTPKKKSAGVVIFIIILLVLLALLTFFLYNYVF